MGGICSKSSRQVVPESNIFTQQNQATLAQGNNSHKQQAQSFDLLRDGLAYVKGELDELPDEQLKTGVAEALDYIHDLYMDTDVNLKESHVKSLLKGLDYLIHFDSSKDWQAIFNPQFQDHPYFITELEEMLDALTINLRSLLAQKSQLNQDTHINAIDTPPKHKRLQHHSRPHAAEVRERTMKQLQSLLPAKLADSTIFQRVLAMAIEFHDFEQEITEVNDRNYDTIEQATVAILLNQLDNDIIQLLKGAYSNDESVIQWVRDFRQACQWLMDHIIEIGTTPIFAKDHVYDVGGRLFELLADVDAMAPYRNQLNEDVFLQSLYLSMGVMGICDKFPAGLPKILNEELGHDLIKQQYPKKEPEPLLDFLHNYLQPYVDRSKEAFTYNTSINQHVFLSILAANVGMCIELAPKHQRQTANKLMSWIESIRCQNSDNVLGQEIEFANTALTNDLQELLLNEQAIKREGGFSANQKVNLESSKNTMQFLFQTRLQQTNDYRLALDIRPDVASTHQSNLHQLLSYYQKLDNTDKSHLVAGLVIAISKQAGECYVQENDNKDQNSVTNESNASPAGVSKKLKIDATRSDRSSSRQLGDQRTPSYRLFNSKTSSGEPTPLRNKIEFFGKSSNNDNSNDSKIPTRSARSSSAPSPEKKQYSLLPEEIKSGTVPKKPGSSR